MLLCSLHFLGYALSLLAGNATMISEDFNMTEVFTVLTEVIRDNFRNAKLKQHLLPALGEFLFYAATQEENLGDSIPQWDVPGEAKQIYIILQTCNAGIKLFSKFQILQTALGRANWFKLSGALKVFEKLRVKHYYSV